MDKALYDALHTISQHQSFGKAIGIRNSGTHRRLTSSVGMMITKPSEGTYAIGTNPYVPTKEVMKISTELQQDFDSVLDVVASHVQ